MATGTLAASPRLLARTAGALYLLTIVLGIFSVLQLGSNLDSVQNAADLIGTIAYAVVTLLLYVLLKPVNPTISLAAALISLIGCVIGGLGIYNIHPIHVNSLVFFGVYCSLLAYLMYNSTFLPKTIGVLLLISGLGWLTYIWPPLEHAISPLPMITGLAGEGGLTLWLLIFGVNEERWSAKARASA